MPSKTGSLLPRLWLYKDRYRGGRESKDDHEPQSFHAARQDAGSGLSGDTTSIPASSEQPTTSPESSTVRGHWQANKGEVILGGLAAIAAAATVAIIASLGGSYIGQSSSSQIASTPAEISTPDQLHEYLLAQPIWDRHPTTFAAMLVAAIKTQASTGHPATVRLNGTGTDVEAHSVSDLAQNGATIHSGAVIIVGRVRAASASPVIWAPNGHETPGPDRDTTLESPNGKTVIYGLIAGSLEPGRVVYFPGVVVAVGDTANGAATAYVVSLAPSASRTPTSGAIRMLINAYAPTR